MPSGFTITYSVDESEWGRTALARWNAEAEPSYDCFYGEVQVYVDGKQLFGDESFHMSVADLACGLAYILQSELPLVGGDADATFRQSDDALEIEFKYRANRVHVSSNFGPPGSATVNAIEFSEGIGDFIREFANDAAAHVPDALSWKDLAMLRSYVSDTT